MEYVLIEAAKLHEERPELLEVLPTKEEIESVGVNDYVRLIFSYGGGYVQMWVKIVTRGEGGARGILISEPVYGMPLEIGATIEFDLGDIARVIPEDQAEAQKGT
jgi:hypothetical protein